MLSGELLFNDALGFFGNSNVRWEDPRQVSEVPRQAVVQFRRFGSNLGIGRDLTVSTQLWLNYRIEGVKSEPPRAASHEYGGTLEPIDFHILPGRTLLSTLRATIQHDTRDQPLLTNRGWLVTLQGDVALRPLGSGYDYQRFDVTTTHWWPLGRGHVFALEGFAGLISGYAPFFEQYYIGDLSAFRPGRVLGLAFDDRPAPNFFDTSIAEIRYGDYAAKLEAEYRYALYRGSRSLYGLDVFASWGLFTLASERELLRPPRDLQGAARFPVDMTANVGFQMDTNLGGFTVSFANVLGFIPIRGDR
jgi:outer membrane protein assembly factor BamA